MGGRTWAGKPGWKMLYFCKSKAWEEALADGIADIELFCAEQREQETVSKPLPNWGKFAICYRNFRSQRKEYGK